MAFIKKNSSSIRKEKNKKRIAVVDVAAECGGALSILNDFCESLKNYHSKDEWFIITSVVDIEEAPNIHNIRIPGLKKSWFHRIIWEKVFFYQLMRSLDIDVVVSLQNEAMPPGPWKQVVYFHNVLFLQKPGMFSFLKKEERKFAVLSYILGPYVRRTWKHADVLAVQGRNVKTQIRRFGIRNRIMVVKNSVRGDIEKCTSKKIKGYIYPASAFMYKNHEAIIRAEKIINERGKKIDVLFTLDGTENEYTRNLFEQCKQVKGITFIGEQSREQIFKYYKQYGVIMVSKLESLGLPMIEAKAANTVIIGLDVPYVKEAIEGYARGYITDEQHLYVAMQKGMDDRNNANFICKNDNGWDPFLSMVLSL